MISIHGGPLHCAVYDVEGQANVQALQRTIRESADGEANPDE
jgi:hypothetical protein